VVSACTAAGHDGILTWEGAPEAEGEEAFFPFSFFFIRDKAPALGWGIISGFFFCSYKKWRRCTFFFPNHLLQAGEIQRGRSYHIEYLYYNLYYK